MTEYVVPGRMRDMSEDSLPGQISERADSLAFGAKKKKLSSKAEPHAGCCCPAKGLGKHHLLQMGTNRYFAAARARRFPPLSQHGMENCVWEGTTGHILDHDLGQGSALAGETCRTFTGAALQFGCWLLREES